MQHGDGAAGRQEFGAGTPLQARRRPPSFEIAGSTDPAHRPRPARRPSRTRPRRCSRSLPAGDRGSRHWACMVMTPLARDRPGSDCCEVTLAGRGRVKLGDSMEIAWRSLWESAPWPGSMLAARDLPVRRVRARPGASRIAGLGGVARPLEPQVFALLAHCSSRTATASCRGTSSSRKSGMGASSPTRPSRAASSPRARRSGTMARRSGSSAPYTGRGSASWFP